MEAIGEPLFVGPQGLPVVILGERVKTLAEAEQRYVGLWALIRYDEQRGGSRACDQQAIRQLGEALAYHRGCTPYDLQAALRHQIARAYRQLLAAVSPSTSR